MPGVPNASRKAHAFDRTMAVKTHDHHAGMTAGVESRRTVGKSPMQTRKKPVICIWPRVHASMAPWIAGSTATFSTSRALWRRGTA